MDQIIKLFNDIRREVKQAADGNPQSPLLSRLNQKLERLAEKLEDERRPIFDLATLIKDMRKSQAGYARARKNKNMTAASAHYKDAQLNQKIVDVKVDEIITGCRPGILF